MLNMSVHFVVSDPLFTLDLVFPSVSRGVGNGDLAGSVAFAKNDYPPSYPILHL